MLLESLIEMANGKECVVNETAYTSFQALLDVSVHYVTYMRCDF